MFFCYFVYKELIGEEQLKEAGLENFPFDATKDHIVHPPKLVKFLIIIVSVCACVRLSGR